MTKMHIGRALLSSHMLATRSISAPMKTIYGILRLETDVNKACVLVLKCLLLDECFYEMSTALGWTGRAIYTFYSTSLSVIVWPPEPAMEAVWWRHWPHPMVLLKLLCSTARSFQVANVVSRLCCRLDFETAPSPVFVTEYQTCRNFCWLFAIQWIFCQQCNFGPQNYVSSICFTMQSIKIMQTALSPLRRIEEHSTITSTFLQSNSGAYRTHETWLNVNETF
jgi:hypothetical protein